jgi:hypothetical protein
VGPRAGLDDVEKILDPIGTQTLTPWSSSLQPVAIPTMLPWLTLIISTDGNTISANNNNLCNLVSSFICIKRIKIKNNPLCKELGKTT